MNTPDTTLYYNSACPVCNAGVCYQKRQMQGRTVAFIDVHTRPDIAEELGIDLELLRERLHVKDPSGQMHVGDAAFIALWAENDGQRWLARVARPFSWLTGPLYKLVARVLYRWNRRRGHW